MKSRIARAPTPRIILFSYLLILSLQSSLALYRPESKPTGINFTQQCCLQGIDEALLMLDQAPALSTLTKEACTQVNQANLYITSNQYTTNKITEHEITTSSYLTNAVEMDELKKCNILKKGCLLIAQINTDCSPGKTKDRQSLNDDFFTLALDCCKKEYPANKTTESPSYLPKIQQCCGANLFTDSSKIVCPEGFLWLPEQRLCMYLKTSCPEGMYLSMKQKICLPIAGPAALCSKGFEYKDDEEECQDVDECAQDILKNGTLVKTCTGFGEVCVNLHGSYKCECGPGYRPASDGDCIDVNECKVGPSVCQQGYVCQNTIGSYRCIRRVPCGYGYVLNDTTQGCEDIDECKEDPDICGNNLLCVNVRGGHKCLSEECPENLRRNSQGQCTPCPKGYNLNKKLKICEDINECELNRTICQEFETCHNRPGDHICEPKVRCTWGLRLNSNGTNCEDIDECKMQTFSCHFGQICENTIGAYRCIESPCHFTELYDYESRRCICDEGFQRKGHGCIDIDECALYAISGDPVNPLCPGNRKCVNIPGSYHCINSNTCHQGFNRSSDEDHCVDIDECATGLANCGENMLCENTVGSFRCLCHHGYRNVNNSACVDIDECKIFRPEETCPDKRARCVNTAGSYKCICLQGFTWSNYPVKQCLDINECNDAAIICGDKHSCVNEPGSYRCICGDGFRLESDNKTCSDIDECSSYYQHNSNFTTCFDGICKNTIGGYECICPSGYRLDRENMCIDINECEEEKDICSSNRIKSIPSSCINLRGGYRCAYDRCPDKYVNERLENGNRCTLKTERQCQPEDVQCFKDLPILLTSVHIEITPEIPENHVLARIDPNLVIKGTVHVELSQIFAYQLRTYTPISVSNAMKLRLSPSHMNQVEVLLTRKLEAPADILVEARLSELHGLNRILKSITKLYIYVTESRIDRVMHERQLQRSNQHIRLT